MKKGKGVGFKNEVFDCEILKEKPEVREFSLFPQNTFPALVPKAGRTPCATSTACPVSHAGSHPQHIQCHAHTNPVSHPQHCYKSFVKSGICHISAGPRGHLLTELLQA